MGTDKKLPALVRRYAKGELNDGDAELIAYYRELKKLREMGLSHEEIARRVNRDRTTIVKTINGTVMKGLMPFFNNEVAVVKQGADDELMAAERREFDHKHGRNALDFYDYCYKKDDQGGWADVGLAQWATQQVTKRRGWDSPDGQAKPIIQINTLIIEKEAKEMEKDEQRLRGVIEGTFEEVE